MLLLKRDCKVNLMLGAHTAMPPGACTERNPCMVKFKINGHTQSASRWLACLKIPVGMRHKRELLKPRPISPMLPVPEHIPRPSYA
eukprot:scaffold11775_cov18-Tisochrysis_lutea.AAC.2